MEDGRRRRRRALPPARRRGRRTRAEGDRGRHLWCEGQGGRAGRQDDPRGRDVQCRSASCALPSARLAFSVPKSNAFVVLFSPAPLRSLAAQVQQLPHVATSTERSGVLYDVRRLLSLRQDAATSNPSDQINQSQILALKKLESLILNTQLTTEQVNQIRGQLAALAPPPPAQRPSASPVPPAPAAPPPASLLSPPVQPAASAAYANLLQPPAPPSASGPGGGSGIDLSLLSKLTASGALANLFSPSSATSTPPPPGIKVEDEGAKVRVKVEDETVTKAERDELAAAWEDEILRLGVGLTNADLVVSVCPRGSISSARS